MALKGLAAAQANLARIGRVVNQPETKGAAEDLAKEISAAAPVGSRDRGSRRPGELKRSFKAQEVKQGRWGVTTTANHAHLVNNGTRRGMPANPFITRTVAAFGRKAARAINEDLAATLRKSLAAVRG